MNDMGIFATLTTAIKNRDKRIAALEQRIKALEQARPANLADAWKGIYSSVETYQRGDLVTKAGGLWLSLTDHNINEPGQDPDKWRLVVKAGRHELR